METEFKIIVEGEPLQITHRGNSLLISGTNIDLKKIEAQEKEVEVRIAGDHLQLQATIAYNMRKNIDLKAIILGSADLYKYMELQASVREENQKFKDETTTEG